MKRIKYIIGACLLLASLITAGTRGYIYSNVLGIITKANENTFEIPNTYWKDGTLEVAITGGPADNVITGDTIITIKETATIELNLEKLIPKADYTYYRLYRSESSSKKDNIADFLSGFQANKANNNNGLRQFGDGSFLWYRSTEYKDLRKSLKYVIPNDAEIGNDELIMEVSTLSDYQCNADEFVRPSEVICYKITIKDERTLKFPTQYWDEGTKDVEVQLQEGGFTAETTQDFDLSGKFSQKLSIDPKYNFAYIKLDGAISFYLDGELKGVSAHDVEGNTAPRMYKNGVAVWYRTKEGNDHKPEFTIYDDYSQYATNKKIGTCTVYLSTELPMITTDANGNTVFTSPTSGEKMTYSFNAKEPEAEYPVVMEAHHEKIDTLYVLPGERIQIAQQTRSKGGIKGYLAWRAEKKNETIDYAWYKKHLSFDGSLFKYYKNGVAGYSTNTTGDLQQGLCYIYYHADENMDENDEVTLIWDASNWKATYKDYLIFTPPHEITIRHKYIIRHAAQRFKQLKKAKEEHENAIKNQDANSLNTAGFFERYDIHTPYNKENGTSFRLVEVLSNYYLKDQLSEEDRINGTLHSACAWGVRWKVYDKDGKPARFTWADVQNKEEDCEDGTKILCYNDKINDWNDKAGSNAWESPNILYCKDLGKEEFKGQQQKYYITAEVGRVGGSKNEQDWYPVSLYTVYLEPYADFKTEDELRQATDEYSARRQSIIEQEYELLDSITFDAPPGETPDYSKPNEAGKNYRPSTLTTYQSEYAISATEAYDSPEGRATGDRTIYRGEYGILKTLNVESLSTTTEKYNDWFCNSGGYYVNVHDRMYEASGGTDWGYFMYVDATDIPGVIVRLPLHEKLCSDTRLLVTAWVCNLQFKDEKATAADLGLTFKGVKGEEEVILNKFYTGAARQVPDPSATNKGNPSPAVWQQVCFYFDFEKGDEAYDSYILEVANNCRHSNGADYAIDDIRVYKMNPELFVEREDACDEEDLVVRAGYEHLLGVYGKSAESSEETAIDKEQDSWTKQILHLGLDEYEFNVYYSFTDDYVKGNLASKSHWLFLDYNNNGSRDSYGRIIVSTSKKYYKELKEKDIKEENNRRKARAILGYKELYESFNDHSEDRPQDALTPDALAKKAADLGISNLFGMREEDLAKNEKFLELSKSFFQSIGVAPIQLSWQTDEDEERGVITLTHITKAVDNTQTQPEKEGTGEDTNIDHNDDKLEVDKDYYVGLFKDEDFMEGTGEIQMDECFPAAHFKISYNGISVFVNTTTEIEKAFVCAFSSADLSAKLKFTYLGNEQVWEGDKVPIDWYAGKIGDEIYRDITEGTSSTPVSLTEALDLFHAQCNPAKNYRGDIRDLQAIAGFEYQQALLKLCDQGLLYLDENNFDFKVTDSRKHVVAIPNERAIISINGTTKYIVCTEPQEFEIKINDETPKAWLGIKDIAYPEDFEQPAVRLGLEDIVKNDKMQKLTIPIRSVEFSGEDANHLGFARERDTDFADIIFTGNTTDPVWKNKAGKVATLESINAKRDDGVSDLRLKFFDFANEEDGTLSGLQFREGFEYELQIRFHEYDVDGVYLMRPCDGIIDFMLKIVPEYVTWTDSNGRNWNNDDNWKRSSEKEIYKGNKSEDNDASDPIRTDLENSFAPMKFTKVTIPGEGANPILLDCKWDDRVISGLEDDLNPATDDIEFDLMVDRESRIADRFYANTCDEIYFKPNATLMSQQYLTYDTARVEFEMKEDQWYLLSSPLKGVVAGDMYSPKTDGGRQVTDAFAPIVFDYENGKNDRFAPAYYQRKWDNTAVLYFRNEGQNPDPDYHDSYLEAEWSTEYNDARVKYSTGTGFSVHVENLPEGGNGVSLVRLPKADQEYSYYSNPQKGDVVNPDGAPQKIDREGNNGRLNPVDTAVVIGNRKEGSKLFLAGNPFMTYLNMKQFFDGNTDLKREYRVRNEKDEEIVVQVSGDGTVTTNVPDGHSGAIAPLEGFFVEVQSTPSTKAAEEMQNEKVKITFSPGMLQADKETETLQTRSLVSGEPTLFITAHRDGKQSSVALVKRQQASVGFVDNEDAVALLNVSDPKTPSLYSIAGTQATCINVTPEMANIPLGVYSEDESDVTLRFAGLEHFGDSLYLYDALKNEEILIDSRNAEVTVPGTTHGRYFLNVSRSIQVGSQIHVYTPMPGQVVVASTAGDLLKSVRVYDLSGKVVSIFDHLSTTVHQFSLPTGFYIVCAESESCTEKSKISVR